MYIKKIVIEYNWSEIKVKSIPMFEDISRHGCHYLYKPLSFLAAIRPVAISSEN